MKSVTQVAGEYPGIRLATLPRRDGEEDLVMDPLNNGAIQAVVPWLATRALERIAAGEDGRELVGIISVDEPVAAIATRAEARQLADVSGLLERSLETPEEKHWLRCFAFGAGKVATLRVCLMPASSGGRA